jgi:hypothetical protein
MSTRHLFPLQIHHRVLICVHTHSYLFLLISSFRWAGQLIQLKWNHSNTFDLRLQRSYFPPWMRTILLYSRVIR